ncbi:MAG: hypothetical protein KDA45_16815, partial [Planctomycetales bacterium]|nr:hypothetical protein [Planctomycetales bacterium]
YDPGVPLLATSNLDVLSPNDPGYRDLVGAAPVATGEYVDLGWARKLATHGATQTAMAAGTNIWSPMSGYSQTNFASNGALAGHTDAILKSGSVLYAGSNPLVMQPAYDTWTTRYEGDGILQSYRNGFSGLVRISGATTLYGMGAGDTSSALPAWRRTNIDAGTDGIDNGMSLAGVDDLSELETSPPYPTPLRGLRISIRMEDPATRLVKQMSVAKEFVTQ